MKTQGLIAKFPIPTDSLCLEHPTQPNKFCEAVGHKAALLGSECGNFEAWVYPLKICQDIELGFIIEHKKWILNAANLAQHTQVRPESTVIRYTHEGFTVRQMLFVPIDMPGAIMLLDIDSFWPLKIAVKFRPVLQPMWPAGLGGQYTLWDEDRQAYLIAEGSKKYHGLIGSPIAQNLSLTPGHHLPDAPMEFVIDVDPELSKKYYIPIFITGGVSDRETSFKIYNQLGEDIPAQYQKTYQHYRKLQTGFMTIKTPDTRVNQAYQWAKAALDKGVVEAPGIGTGLVAGYGLSGQGVRPGFAWFFGGDAFLNSLAFNSYGDFDTIRQSLCLWREYQREDGKIFHEFSLSGKLVNWFDDYAYGFYHADTTPYYIVAMHDFWQRSGDAEFIRESWDSIKRAYEFCRASDSDGDGLMENSSAGLAAMEVGALASGIKIDIYLASVWLKAIKCMIELAELLNDSELKQTSDNLFVRARQSFSAIFYDKQQETLRFAELENGEYVTDISAWNAVALAFELLDDVPLDGLFRTLASADMSTDWGVRLLSKTSVHYDPVNYNNGSVWPFVNGYVALAEYRRHQPLAAFERLMGNIYSAEADSPGFHTELLSGEYFRALSTSVPHQLFSSSQVITPIVRGLLGLHGDANKRVVSFSPQLPYHWQYIEFQNYRVGDAVFHGSISIKNEHYVLKMQTNQAKDFKLLFSPAFAPGTQIENVKINGNAANFKQETVGKCVLCAVELTCAPAIEIDIEYKKGVEILPDLKMPAIGEPTRKLKIIDYEVADDQFRVTVQGRCGQDYFLDINHSGEIEKIHGAQLVETGLGKSRIQISFPRDEAAEFGEIEIDIVFRVPA